MTQTVSAPAAPAGPPQYEPLDFFVVRAPLLPVEAYRDLSRATQGARAGAESGPKAWLARDDIRRALAVGSETLLTAAGAAKNGARQSKIDAKLLRYLIRMSTRPTPFGLFAGVALGRWNGRTTLALAAGPRTQRTRPDMEWLLRVVLQLEALPEVRRRLRLIANPAALEAGGRVHLAERVSRGETVAPPAVSIRATGVVRRALDAARTPVSFEQLASTLLEQTPGATTERIEQLLTELWEQTLLLTDLRPPLAVESPIEHVIHRLEGVPAAARVRERLRDLTRAAAAWDGAPPEDDIERFRAMAADAGTIAPIERSPFQVDSAVGLVDNGLSRRVGEEAARAAALLLRLSPAPRGPAYLIAYRRLFAQRYGAHREVPVLQLLDPNFGLGPPAMHGPLSAGGLGIAPARWARRNDALMELATHALRDRRRSVDLDDEMIERLETWDGSALPPSVDLYVSVSATSRDALDAGEFHVVVGPNVGSLAAGRGLGRFTDLLAGARDALRRAAEAEEARAPQHLWAELTYQPRHLRLGNVSIRPNVRAHEIPVGVSAGPDSVHVVPLGELVVGVRDERFYVRWPAAGRDVTITAGHMLSPVRAPAVCRFLSEIGRDGCCQLAGFGWGPAAGFPFLPRVQVGRIVLSLAQWRLTGGTLPDAGRGQQTFEHALARWRTRWGVPSHVYLSAGDNRLLLDLCDGSQVDQLRRALRQLRGHGTLMLTEVFPDLEHAWVEDGAGRHFVTELVVPLVRRAATAPRPAPVVRRAVDETRFSKEPRQTAVPPLTHGRPPGTEWVFAKIYCGRALEDDLLAGPTRSLAHRFTTSGLANGWFFVRYNDPDRHIRLRFRGVPERLVKDLLPGICAWAIDRMREGVCTRFALDTYEREIERFGGPEGLEAAERLFAADSEAVLDLLALERRASTPIPRMYLAVLTVDTLLDGLGLDVETRIDWSRSRVRSREEGSRAYRQGQRVLRALLGDPAHLPAGQEIARALATLHRSAAVLRERLDELQVRGVLTRTVNELRESCVHLHVNRVLGGPVEARVLGLHWRVRESLLRSPFVRPAPRTHLR